MGPFFLPFRPAGPALAVLLALLLAGCADDATPAAADDATLAVGPLGPDAPRGWQGTCPCPPLSFDAVPAAAPGRGWLEATVSWDGAATPGLAVGLVLPNGTVVPAERGFDAARVQVWDAPAGPYALRLTGAGDVAVRLRLRDLDGPVATGPDLLPNLVTLVPVEPAVEACRVDEEVEQGARRCLRLGNAVGNTGDGPLEVRLAMAEGLLAPAGLGAFVQRIYDGAGGHRDVPVGTADFHVVHGHFHYRGLARFALFPVADDGRRATEAAAGSKAGFCFLDWGEMQERDVERGEGGRAGQDCLFPGEEGWSMGISVGWYDYYWSDLADQYIDVEGLPDGTYELVSWADATGSLLETDESDNAASLVLRLAGDRVEVVEERGFYRNPEP